jgi:hypothetical protein
MAFERYIEFVRRISPTVMLGHWGERLQGTLSGLLWDLLAQGASEGVIAPLLTTPDQPVDALPPIAEERNLAKYLDETNVAWQARLLAAWDIWEQGGSATEIQNELEAAGYTGAEIHSPIDWGRTPIPWESQFWVFLPEGAHAGLFSQGSEAGDSGTIAGEHLAGISGDFERVAELRHIAQTFRPGDQVCRQILVEIESATCGANGVLCGNHLCGGVVAPIGTGIQEV